MPDELIIFGKKRHASPHHLHMTNRRFFIGPIPEGWLQHHRKSWYKEGIRLKNYSSKTVSFSADPVVVRYEEDPTENEPSSSAPEQGTSNDAGNRVETEEEDIQGEQDNEPNGQELAGSSGEAGSNPGRGTAKSQTTPTTETGAPLTLGLEI